MYLVYIMNLKNEIQQKSETIIIHDLSNSIIPIIEQENTSNIYQTWISPYTGETYKIPLNEHWTKKLKRHKKEGKIKTHLIFK